MADWPMAWAKWLLPVPGGPKNKASSWRAMKAPVARSKTRLRFIFLLKLKSKLSRFRHYRAKYHLEPHLPIWMLTELVSFGVMSKMTEGVKKSVRKQIARDFNI